MPTLFHTKYYCNKTKLVGRFLSSILPGSFVIALMILSSCANKPLNKYNNSYNTFASTQKFSADFKQKFNKLVTKIPPEQINNETRDKARQGLELISEDKLEQGSVMLNSALQLDTTNSYLQFFNAFAYHLMAQHGDTQKYSLARQGYLLAIKFDRSNWIAHYFMAILYMERRNYTAAQNELAEVLLFREDDHEVLSLMVAASYYSGDVVTAAACLNRLYLLNPTDTQVLRLSAIISAAMGKNEDAESLLQRYQSTKPDEIELAKTKQRIKHWLEVYRNTSSKPSNSNHQSNFLSQNQQSQHSQHSQHSHLIKTGFGSFGGYKSSASSNLGSNSDSDTDSDDLTNDGKPASNRMVLVDVVLMYITDALSTSKGVNLLSALTLQFGNVSTNTPAFSRISSRGNSKTNDLNINDGNSRGTNTENSRGTSSSTDTFDDGTDISTNIANAITNFDNTSITSGITTDIASGIANTADATTTLLSAITIPALTYSMNIANSNNNTNEVLARPTLAALDGMTSKFFSGETLNAAVVSSGTSGGDAVQIEKQIGVKLDITPNFLPDGKIKLKVRAERTFLKPPSSDVAFTYKISETKVMVKSNVVMEFGETLVLGGLSEKETTNIRDGVPFLQDIPIVQYFFSNKKMNNYQHSVLMLITPRSPQYTFRSNNVSLDYNDTSQTGSFKEFRARYGDWFAPYPNMASVFNQLGSSSIYREFRTGDVTLEKWDRQETTLERLKQALDFLFY